MRHTIELNEQDWQQARKQAVAVIKDATMTLSITKRTLHHIDSMLERIEAAKKAKETNNTTPNAESGIPTTPATSEELKKT